MKRSLVAVFTALLAFPAAGQCPGDVVETGVIDGIDLAAVLGAWGTSGQGSFDTDTNDDGIVDGIDLATVLGGWGACPVPQVPSWATLVQAAPDPAIVASSSMRAAIVASGWAWRVKDTATQMEMLLIPPGTFSMGCSPSMQWPCSSAELPVHSVTLTNPFYLGRYEVTQAQWSEVMGGNPSTYRYASAYVAEIDVPRRPVETVSWNTVQEYLAAVGMRLPTDAEWEYAHRAGTATAFHGFAGHPAGTNDDSLLGNIAWFSDNANWQPRPVGGRQGNGLGLHDMAGNVSEFVQDWYAEYTAKPQIDPQGPASGDHRVIRGGSCFHQSFVCNSYARQGMAPGSGLYETGFRVARNP